MTVSYVNVHKARNNAFNQVTNKIVVPIMYNTHDWKMRLVILLPNVKKEGRLMMMDSESLEAGYMFYGLATRNQNC